jgi:hypothetical protein
MNDADNNVHVMGHESPIAQEDTDHGGGTAGQLKESPAAITAKPVSKNEKRVKKSQREKKRIRTSQATADTPLITGYEVDLFPFHSSDHLI